ncbi:hypothetical protein [Nocardia arthritidis]|uniref:Type II toxin-antitoxin system RelE/ParE family toxin n=1 Tax=Nocardia arthritidis TaxID=228602 RepID=A0A6G9Y4H6_9NOCA|nr:hypothetical protein [Nocardia arthritidis]QIS08054.1 hypothetical protein F5544_00605 [Nocardia arthritidis]
MYRIITDPDVADQIAALPVEALPIYAELLGVLQLTPWSGPPQHEENPDGAVRHWLFGPDGRGEVIYLIHEEGHEVHVLMVLWLG